MIIAWNAPASAPGISWPLPPACDHAEDGQIVAVQTDSAVLLLRLICNGELLADAPRSRREHVIRFDELPGAKIIGKAVEVRHIFEWAKKGTDNEEE